MFCKVKVFKIFFFLIMEGTAKFVFSFTFSWTRKQTFLGFWRDLSHIEVLFSVILLNRALISLKRNLLRSAEVENIQDMLFCRLKPLSHSHSSWMPRQSPTAHHCTPLWKATVSGIPMKPLVTEAGINCPGSLGLLIHSSLALVTSSL